MSQNERRLRRLLRITGIVCVTALLPMFMPRSWIESAHAWMGMGEFPKAPIAEYLARSTSGLASFYGGLLLVLARDIRKHHTVIRYQTIAIMGLATAGFFLGVRAGIPWFWVGVDVVGCYLLCVPMLFLLRRVSLERDDLAGRKAHSDPVPVETSSHSR